MQIVYFMWLIFIFTCIIYSFSLVLSCILDLHLGSCSFFLCYIFKSTLGEGLFVVNTLILVCLKILSLFLKGSFAEYTILATIIFRKGQLFSPWKTSFHCLLAWLLLVESQPSRNLWGLCCCCWRWWW